MLNTSTEKQTLNLRYDCAGSYLHDPKLDMHILIVGTQKPTIHHPPPIKHRSTVGKAVSTCLFTFILCVISCSLRLIVDARTR